MAVGHLMGENHHLVGVDHHPMVAAVRRSMVVADLSVGEVPAADGNKKIYTLYRFLFGNAFIIVNKGVGFSCFNRSGCR